MVFIFPAILLHFLIVYYEIPGVWNFIIKVVILVFFVGTPFIPIGFSHLLWRPDNKSLVEVGEEKQIQNSNSKFQLSISLIITLLTLATAIVQLLSQLNN